jgi:hypothetical protein
MCFEVSKDHTLSLIFYYLTLSPGFRRNVDEIYALLGYYAASFITTHDAA